MEETIEFLVRYGYTVVFLVVLVQQLGLPIPSPPLLLAAGALAGEGRMSLVLILLLAVVASLIGDVFWYEIGRRRGGKVLSFLCRVALEPDACVRKTENAFARNSVRTLLIAKFIPGLTTMAPPLAGIVRMPLGRFVLLDSLGALIYFGSFAVLGYVFSDQLERVADRAEDLGFWFVVILVAALAAYVAWKYYQRWSFIRKLRVARISVEELQKKLEAGEPIVVVDLRHAIDSDGMPHSIPGAIRMTPEHIEEHHHKIPRDREIVVYCT